MNPADEEAARLVPIQGPSPGVVAGSNDNLKEQIHSLEEQLHEATLKDLQRANHQSKAAEDLHGADDRIDEQLRVSVEELLHLSPPPKPELDDLLSAITHHLDQEASERKAIHHRLVAMEDEMKGQGPHRFAGYLVAICIGLVAAFAWQSYAEPTKVIIATKAPDLGWSPEAKQMIAGWMRQLGWTKPLAVESKAAPVAQTAPATPSVDPEQVHQIALDVAALRQTVERHLADVQETVEKLTAGQDQMAREIEKLQAADAEILAKIASPPPQPPAASARKTTPVHLPPKLAPTPFWGRSAPHP
jgi:hypothetical protein